MFRNLTFFRFNERAADPFLPAGADELDAAFNKRALRPVGPMELSSRGWGPFGADDGRQLAYRFGAGIFGLCLRGDDKVLPSAAVFAEVDKKAKALEAQRGKSIGGRERKRLKDEVLSELLPRALVTPSSLLCYLDTRNGLAVIDASSRKAAEDLLTVLRETLETFPALPLDPEEAPRAVLTGWLSGGRLPDGIQLGQDCDLRNPASQGATAKLRRQDLHEGEIGEHLKSGKQCVALGLIYRERISFVLDEHLVVRKLKFLDVVMDELSDTDRDTPAEEFDARFHMLVGEVAALFEMLDDVFRLPRPRNREVPVALAA